VRNTTDAVNQLALSLDFSKRREVVTTNLEHHSNLLPWVRLEQDGKIKLRIVEASADGAFDLDDFAGAVKPLATFDNHFSRAGFIIFK